MPGSTWRVGGQMAHLLAHTFKNVSSWQTRFSDSKQLGGARTYFARRCARHLFRPNCLRSGRFRAAVAPLNIKLRWHCPLPIAMLPSRRSFPLGNHPALTPSFYVPCVCPQYSGDPLVRTTHGPLPTATHGVRRPPSLHVRMRPLYVMLHKNVSPWADTYHWIQHPPL